MGSGMHYLYEFHFGVADGSVDPVDVEQASSYAGWAVATLEGGESFAQQAATVDETSAGFPLWGWGLAGFMGLLLMSTVVVGTRKALVTNR